MNLNETISEVKEFLEKRNTISGEKEIIINYKELIMFNPSFADNLHLYFDDFLKIFNVAYQSMDKENRDCEFQFKELPESMSMGIGEIRKDHIDRFYKFEGTVLRVGDQKIMPKVSKFECPSCLPKGTKVLTPAGYKPIEESKVVISLDPMGVPIPVDCKILKKGKKEVWYVNNIPCSHDHKWFVYRNGSVQVIQTKDLNINDELIRVHDKMHNLWKRKSEQKQTNVFGRMQKKKLFSFSNWQGKNKSRQPGNNKTLQEWVFNSENSNNSEYKSQTNQKKINKIWCKDKNCVGTMQNKFLQKAWQEMWGKRISKISKRKFGMEMSNLLKIEGQKQRIVSPSQGWESLQQFSRESDGTLSIMPYKITSLARTSEKVEMYDLQVPLLNNFILENGVITHNCGNIINVLQIGEKEREPIKCGCGRKGKFRLLSRTWKNVKHIVVEEFISDYTDKKAKPSTIKVILEEGLTCEKLAKKLQPGKRIIFNALVLAKQSDNPKKNAYFDFELKANWVTVGDKSLFNMKIPANYVTKFKQMKGTDIIKDLSESMFANIEGNDVVKEILLVSRARGIKTYHQDGQILMKDTINVFLIGNPGSAKTDLAKLCIKVDPGSMTVSGKGTSGAGLTGTCTFDKDLGCWSIEPGVIPRCNHSSAIIDEVDKMNDEITSSLNEAMTNLSFMIAKANQQVMLQADTNIIGIANPEGRTFDPMIERYRQIPLKTDFLDRFDIMAAIEKVSGSDNQKKVISKIVGRFNKGYVKGDTKYDLTYLQYYYSWVIQNFKPKITDEVTEYASNEINKIMNKTSETEKGKSISYRLVGNIIRFAIAIAKLNQYKEVTEAHIDKSIFYQKFGFQSLDMLDEQGNISEERINFEVPKLISRKSYTMGELIVKLHNDKKAILSNIEDKSDLSAADKDCLLELKEIQDAWINEGHECSENEFDEMIDKLQTRGDIFCPRRGFVRPIN